MPREFNVPSFYRSPAVLAVKDARRQADPKKKDLRPSVLDFGPVRFHLGRHFGFCFGVENAIEIAYKVLRENPDRRVFLLSEMIHNHQVNSDLLAKGVRFLMKTDGTRLIDFSELNSEDIVVVPAFGTTVELQNELSALGIDPYQYDATCPFVEKVWKRADELGRKGFTVILHGKRTHEETRATFSHSRQTAPTLVVLNMAEAQQIIRFMKGAMSLEDFKVQFARNMSDGFDPEKDLSRIGVVNQTTMLATETQSIAEAFKQAILEIHGQDLLAEHYADTRDTLCYATYENQGATLQLREAATDLAIVVGGYNSSNTSHLVELLEEEGIPTFYIRDAEEIIDATKICHFDLAKKEVVESRNWLPTEKIPLDVAITAGASCPDSAVDAVMQRIISLCPEAKEMSEVLSNFAKEQAN